MLTVITVIQKIFYHLSESDAKENGALKSLLLVILGLEIESKSNNIITHKVYDEILYLLVMRMLR